MTESKEKVRTGYRHIPVTRIVAPAPAVRFDVSGESVDELAESIKKIGLIEPLIVKQNKDKYEIIAGHRRFTACLRAAVKNVKCIVVDVNETDQETIKMHENTQRLNVSPVEQGVYFSYLVQKKKMKQSEIAEMMNVSEGFVSQRLSIMSWHDDLISAVDGGQISFSSARELSRITEEAALLSHLRQAVEHGVTPRVANVWWQDWLKLQGADITGAAGKDHSNDTPAGGNTSFNCGLCGEPFEYNKMVYLRLCNECYRELQDAHKRLTTGDRQNERE